MKNYLKPLLEESFVITDDVILLSTSDETLGYDKGVDEEWD